MSPIRQLAKDYFDGLLDQSEYRQRRKLLLAQQIGDAHHAARLSTGYTTLDERSPSRGDREMNDSVPASSVEIFAAEFLEPQPQADDLSAALSGGTESSAPVNSMQSDGHVTFDHSVTTQESAQVLSSESAEDPLRSNRTIEIEPEVIETGKVAARTGPTRQHGRRLLVLVYVLAVVFLIYKYDRNLIWLRDTTGSAVQAVQSAGSRVYKSVTDSRD
ncbi:MAG: hypothetical protein AAGI88_02355 [Pseudomonadota bacterium]